MQSLGQQLKRDRELRQVSLEEVSHTTRIPLRMLEHIEADRFDELPGDVFARGFLKSYARALGMSPDEVIARFDADAGPEPDSAPAPIAAITPPERGRRFGIGIALVILLILFTLALSIVLRPRHRDAPIELSSVTCPEDLPSPMLSFSAPSTIATPTASSRS
jgi:cytoskeletal protein RodZ